MNFKSFMMWCSCMACLTIGESAATVLIADHGMSRMIELNAKQPYCKFHTDRDVIQRMLLASDQRRVRQMTNNAITELANICKSNGVTSMHQGGFIYPGTKWCGPGNTARDFHDLGVAEAEDRCCREHDFCPNQIESGHCKNGICNASPFTRSHCDCDARFRRCLQHLNTEVANTLGAIFFNVVQIICFKERRPCSQWQRSCSDDIYQRAGPYWPSAFYTVPSFVNDVDSNHRKYDAISSFFSFFHTVVYRVSRLPPFHSLWTFHRFN